MNDPTGRRDVLIIGLGGAVALLAGCAGDGGARHANPNKPVNADSEPKKVDAAADGEEDVAPAEDLMREHGVLNRVLLVYEECVRRIDTPPHARPDLDPQSLADAARIVRTFIEDYHEKLEEDHLFPRYRAANKLVDLVDTLTLQHQAGRRVTERIEALATMRSLRDPDESRELDSRIRQFVRMYRPHESREDTILFPALHEIVSRNEYDALGEQFERIERQQLGAEGFERAVERVAEIEKRLGIYDLKQFTPPL
jgi:hemerythrin-like domain-containing protein